MMTTLLSRYFWKPPNQAEIPNTKNTTPLEVLPASRTTRRKNATSTSTSPATTRKISPRPVVDEQDQGDEPWEDVDLEQGGGMEIVSSFHQSDNDSNNNNNNNNDQRQEQHRQPQRRLVASHPPEQLLVQDKQQQQGGDHATAAASSSHFSSRSSSLQHEVEQERPNIRWPIPRLHSEEDEKEDEDEEDNAVPPPPPCSSSSSSSSSSSPSPQHFSYKPTKAPKETLHSLYKAGQYKAGLPLNILIVQSFMAGVYIAMAGHLYLAVGGGVLGAALFPTGLIAVILTSAELFTGDALVFVAALLGGKVRLSQLVRNWTVAWLGNFAGCLFWASLVAFASDSLEDLHRVDLALAVAHKKALQPWSHILIKAMGANFMVCLGVWQATCSEDVAGKVLALWFPIAGFVMLGFEHVIANQFFLPVAMIYDQNDAISVGQLWYALSAATIGNVIGGGLLVGAVYWYVFDSMTTTNNRRNRHTRSNRTRTIRARKFRQTRKHDDDKNTNNNRSALDNKSDSRTMMKTMVTAPSATVRSGAASITAKATTTTIQ